MGFKINGQYIPDLIIDPEQAKKIGLPPTAEEVERVKKMLKDRLDKKNNQSSYTNYIEVTCADNTDPESNLLMLHTEPYTFIKLQPGKNILTVEEYPALRYGFSQVPDVDDERVQSLNIDLPDPYENGQEINEVDFSHFDASEMITMKDMFWAMSNIKKISFGKLNTSSLVDTSDAFRWVGDRSNKIPILDLTGLDFSNVKNMRGMFLGLACHTLDLSRCDFSNVVNSCFDLFLESDIKELILDNTILSKEALSSIELLCDELTISLKGWKDEDIKTLIEQNENLRLKCTGCRDKTTYILDENLDYKLYKNDEGEIECTIIKKIGIPSRWFQIKGSVLQRFNGSNSNVIAVPDGIETIADNAFENAANLTTIILPETIKKIGHYAFKGCTSLQCINIPPSVAYIGVGAFYHCKSLTSLYIPDSVTECGILIESIDHLRIPITVINQWEGLMDFFVRHLVIGLPKGIKDPNDVSDDNYLSELWINQFPTIIFEPYECSHFGENQIVSIDGALIYVGEIELYYLDNDDFDDEHVCAFKIADNVSAIPLGVDTLCTNCVSESRRKPLYIPDSVEHIAPDAFDMWGESIRLVTKKSNYDHLKAILPPNMSKVRIYLI